MLSKPESYRKGLLLATLFGLIFMSWYYIAFLMTMNMEPVMQWTSVDIAMLFVMWSIMMVGMMLPAAVPVIMLVNQLNQKRKARHASYAHTMYFVLGYLLAWFIYSLIITFIQWWLHHLSIITPMMVSGQLWFTSLLLALAGVYQWLPLKQRCLQLCRSPLSVIMKEWREGIVGAILMGFRHGQYCLGCCWFLMALLFVAGVMNLKWVLVLTIVVMVEKLVPRGDLISKILGLGLIISAFVLVIR